MHIKQDSVLPLRNLAFGTFGQLITVFSTKVNLFNSKALLKITFIGFRSLKITRIPLDLADVDILVNENPNRFVDGKFGWLPA